MIAMHVAAANPQAIDSAGLDPALVAREKDVLAEKFKAQGKPANVIEKIVESGLKTYYKEVCLLDQPYIHDDKKTSRRPSRRPKARSARRSRSPASCAIALGEGIEKQESDFAAEVAAAAGQELTGLAPLARPQRHGMASTHGRPRLSPRDRQGLRRGARRRRRLRHPSADHRPHRRRSGRRARARHRARRGGRRRQHPARRRGVGAEPVARRPPTPWECWRP